MQIEALFLSFIGVLLGSVMSAALVAYLGEVGISLNAMGGEAAQQSMAQMQAGSVESIYPAFSAALTTAPLVLIIGAQLSALFCMLRVRRLNPVEALRAE